jgi:hypothetical protein
MLQQENRRSSTRPGNYRSNAMDNRRPVCIDGAFWQAVKKPKGFLGLGCCGL